MDNLIAGSCASSALTRVDFPAPEGATTMNRLPEEEKACTMKKVVNIKYCRAGDERQNNTKAMLFCLSCAFAPSLGISKSRAMRRPYSRFWTCSRICSIRIFKAIDASDNSFADAFVLFVFVFWLCFCFLFFWCFLFLLLFF